MDAAAPSPAAGKRDVERFLCKAGGELRVGQLRAASLKRLLDALLGRVVGGTRRALFLRRIAGGPKRGELCTLAQETRFRILQGRGIARRAECGERAVDDAR
jgi:hypothetical protein